MMSNRTARRFSNDIIIAVANGVVKMDANVWDSRRIDRQTEEGLAPFRVWPRSSIPPTTFSAIPRQKGEVSRYLSFLT